MGVSPEQKNYAVLSYFTWVGWVVAMLAGDRNDEFLRFHLNQGLVLWIAGLLGLIPVVGWIWEILLLVLWLIGLIGACRGKETEVPILGKIHILR